MKKIALAFLFLLVSFSAHSESGGVKDEVARAVADASSVTIFSLEPAARETGKDCTGLCYFGWPVLGQTSVTRATAKTIRNDLSVWVAAPEPKAIQLCFNPRHGVRLIANGHTYDFVVCFECAQAEVFKDSAAEPLAHFYYNANQKGWDVVLSAAHVPLAAPAEADGT